MTEQLPEEVRRARLEAIAERWRVPAAMRGAVVRAALRDDVVVDGERDVAEADAMTRAVTVLLRMAITDHVGREHGDRLWSLAGLLGCPVDEREALLVEVMVQFSRRVDGYKPELGSYGGWLTGFVRNVWRNHRRRGLRGRRNLSYVGAVDEQVAVPAAGIQQVEDRESLRWLLDQLSPPLREAWVLQEVEGLTQEEIARLVGRPKGTVGRRIALAKKKIRAIVEAHRERFFLPLPLLLSASAGPDDVIRRLVDAARVPSRAPPGVLEQLRQRVRERVLQERGARGRPSRPPPLRSAARWAERGAMWAAGALSAWALHRPASAPPPREVVREVVRRVEVPAAPPIEAAVPAAPAPAVSARVEPRRAPRDVTARAAVDEREFQWIEQAESALGRGQLDDARAALANHAREFPHGALAQERETLRAQLAPRRFDGASAGAR